MTNKDILSQFPDGDLKNIMQELIVGGVSKVKQSGLKAQYVLSPGQRPG